ncbi:hypothetical protein ACIRRX_32925 [Streptomyces bacillaris]
MASLLCQARPRGELLARRPATAASPADHLNTVIAQLAHHVYRARRRGRTDGLDR